MNPSQLTSATPWLFLGFGWQWDEGNIWRVTDRAHQDADFMAGRKGDARRHEPRPHDPLAASDGAHGFRPHNLPIVIVCPFCGAPQRLMPRLLGVDPHRHEHTLVNRQGLNGSQFERVLCCSGGRDHGTGCAALVRDRMT
jgi:hypothetical protein